jgi:hypothetical protein
LHQAVVGPVPILQTQEKQQEKCKKMTGAGLFFLFSCLKLQHV